MFQPSTGSSSGTKFYFIILSCSYRHAFKVSQDLNKFNVKKLLRVANVYGNYKSKY